MFFPPLPLFLSNLAAGGTDFISCSSRKEQRREGWRECWGSWHRALLRAAPCTAALPPGPGGSAPFPSLGSLGGKQGAGYHIPLTWRMFYRVRAHPKHHGWLLRGRCVSREGAAWVSPVVTWIGASLAQQSQGAWEQPSCRRGVVFGPKVWEQKARPGAAHPSNSSTEQTHRGKRCSGKASCASQGLGARSTDGKQAKEAATE